MNGRYVSLFSGIGGLDIAVERWFGYEPAAFVEWDAACQRVLVSHWPGVPIFGDIKNFGASALADADRPAGSQQDLGPSGRVAAPRRGNAERLGLGDHGTRIDLICGGFPCQPASHAGKRKGTADDRWLWPEFARVVGELRPRYVLVENVAGLLTVNGGRAFSEVIGDLASLGYDATWRSVRASDVGAPHRRERIFLLAERPDTDSIGRDLGRQGALAPGHRGQPQPRPRGLGAFSWGAYEPAIRRWERVMGPAPHPVDEANRLSPDFVEFLMGFPPGWNGGESRTQRLKQLGNAVVWQQAFAALTLLQRETAPEGAVSGRAR